MVSNVQRFLLGLFKGSDVVDLTSHLSMPLFQNAVMRVFCRWQSLATNKIGFLLEISIKIDV